jgi:hypothetical protein
LLPFTQKRRDGAGFFRIELTESMMTVRRAL